MGVKTEKKKKSGAISYFQNDAEEGGGDDHDDGEEGMSCRGYPTLGLLRICSDLMLTSPGSLLRVSGKVLQRGHALP